MQCELLRDAVARQTRLSGKPSLVSWRTYKKPVFTVSIFREEEREASSRASRSGGSKERVRVIPDSLLVGKRSGVPRQRCEIIIIGG